MSTDWISQHRQYHLSPGPDSRPVFNDLLYTYSEFKIRTDRDGLGLVMAGPHTAVRHPSYAGPSIVLRHGGS
jgi:hypothetical protein